MSGVTEACTHGKCELECHISNFLPMSMSLVISTCICMHVESIKMINKAKIGIMYL